MGLVIVLWLCRQVSGRVTLLACALGGFVLIETHTRTALVAMTAGLLVAGLSVISVNRRVRKAFAWTTGIVTVAILTLSSFLTTWLARGEGTQQLTNLTGRTNVWAAVENTPRNKFQVIFGFGLSNKSYNGLPVDSNWLACYLDEGLVGVILSATVLLFVLISAFFMPQGKSRALALYLSTYVLIASFTETGFSDASSYLLELTLAASLIMPSFSGARRTGPREAWHDPERATPVRGRRMRIVIAHSRYRSAAPSGENRVVDQEAAALAGLGHEVELFERRSDDIEGWPAARKAALPAAVVWNGGVRRDLREVLRSRRPDVVHVHNTFPLLSASVLYACRDARVPVVATIHNYKLVCASGDFFRDGAVCHDCAQGLPVGALRHGCYRDSRAATAPVALAAVAHRRAWQTLVSAYACISASQRDLLRGVGLPADRVFVRHNMIPAHPVAHTVRRPEVVYAADSTRPRACRCCWRGGTATWTPAARAEPGDRGLGAA